MTTITLAIAPHGKPQLRAAFPDIDKLRVGEKTWRYLDGGLGVHLFRTSGHGYAVRLTNGVVAFGADRGTVFVDWIELEVLTEIGERQPVTLIDQKGHVRTGSNGVRFAMAQDCIPPRAAYTIDLMVGEFDPRAIYDVMPRARIWEIGGIPLPLPRCAQSKWHFGSGWLDRLKSGFSDGLGGLSDAPLGMWHYLYQAQAYQPGAIGIDPIGGWHDDATTTLLGARLVMRRTHLDALDVYGEPTVFVSEFPNTTYSMARGCRTDTTLASFHDKVPGADQYDTRTQPRSYNAGACAYYAKIHGFSRDNDVNAPDDQHFQRVLAYLVAAANVYADPVARFELEVLANDVVIASASPADIYAGTSGGRGHDWYGTRGWAWRLMSLVSAGEWPTLADAYATAAVGSQMGNGLIQRGRSSQRFSLGWSPDAWTKSAAIQTPIPIGVDACPTMEAVFCAHALAAAGEWRAATNLAAGLLLPRRNLATFMIERPSVAALNGGDLPKFVGVGVTNGATFKNATHFAGGRDYFEWSLPGLFALRSMVLGNARDAGQWIASAMGMTTPGGLKVPTLENVPEANRQQAREAEMLRLLELDPMGWGQTAAMIQALRMRANGGT